MRLLVLFGLLMAPVLLPVGARADDNAQGSTYHADAARSGRFITPGLTWGSAATATLSQTFTGSVSGAIHAQPLYWKAPGATHGVVLVATDADVVQAIDAGSGAQVWRTVIGTPDSASVPNCGPPRFKGVFGTPAIDPVAGTIYVAGSILDGGGNAQWIVTALSLADGSVRPGWPVTLSTALAARGLTFDPILQGQRPALALANGTLYVGFGGNHGDCGNYHGWVVGLDVASASLSGAWEARGVKGGIWSEGGVTSDGTSLFVTTGNAVEKTGWLDGEAVFRLPPTLAHVTDTHDYYYAPNFAALDKGDFDLGGTSPAPIDVPVAGGGTAHWLFQLGKDGNAYILDRSNLGGGGGSLLVQAVTQGEIITAPAIYPVAGGVMAAFNGPGANCPAPSGNPRLTVVKVTASPAPAISTVWCASLASTGAPIVTTTDGTSDPVVWITGAGGDHQLHGYRGDNGTELFAGGGGKDSLPGLQRFSTLLAAEGRLFIGGAGRLFAFDYTPGL